MQDFIDSIFFKELSEQDPSDVCRRALCTYDDTSGTYTISVWGDSYIICPGWLRVEHKNEKLKGFHPYFDLFAVHYLLKAKETIPLNQWISEKDIPGGAAFFRGPHEVPTGLITARFNDDLNGFKKRCEQLMGTPVPLADTAFVFKITPRIPVAVLYWAGDDEFPAESKILYDKTIVEQLALDIIFALAVGICERLGSSSR